MSKVKFSLTTLYSEISLPENQLTKMRNMFYFNKLM